MKSITSLFAVKKKAQDGVDKMSITAKETATIASLRFYFNIVRSNFSMSSTPVDLKAIIQVRAFATNSFPSLLCQRNATDGH